MKDRIQYGYDRAGNRTWRKNLVAPENQDQHYLYDPLYQVTAAARGNLNLNQTAIGGIPAQRQTFTYGPTGNWERYTTAENGVEVLNQNRILNQANQIVQIDGSNTGLLYDRAGNATQMPPNAAGDWSQHYKLTWDAWNRLLRVEDQDDELVASYAYDGTTRRTTKEVSDEVTHSYYNEKWKAIEERVDESEDAHLQYLWGSRPNHRDELVRRDRDADDSGSLEDKLYCLMDYFDPTSVTDEEGSVQERYQFSAFGLRTITDANWAFRSISEVDFEFAFHGQLLDLETRYYNYGYRCYSPQLGKWLTKDPLEEGGGFLLYGFCNNRPTNATDRYGLAAWAWLLVPLIEPVVDEGLANIFGKGVYWAPVPCDKDPKGRIETRFIQVLWKHFTNTVGKVDRVGVGAGQVPEGSYLADPTSPFYPQQFINGIFTDNPSGLFSVPNFEVCKICWDNCAEEVLSVGPCRKWQRGMHGDLEDPTIYPERPWENIYLENPSAQWWINVHREFPYLFG